MAGYQVGIASETKAFKQGVESGIIEPLEDAQKELVDLGKNKGPDQLEKGMKGAERATESLGDETKRVASGIEREFRDTYRKVKQSSDESTRSMSENLDDVRQEAEQSAKETFASFDGSFGSIIDMAQEVSAQAFSGFGPAGLVAGLAAAAGIGAAVSGFEAVGEAEQASRERASEWAQAYVEAGSRVLTAAITVAKQQEIATDPEKYKTAEENAKNWGVSVEVAMAAMAGESWALAAANDALTASEQRAAEEAVKLADGGEALADMLLGASAEARAGRDALDQLHDEMARGSEQAQALSRSLLNSIEQYGTLAVEIDELGNRLVTLPDGTEILIDVQTGLASANVDKFKGDVDGVIDQLNAREIVVQARGAFDRLQHDFDQFVSRNEGTEIRVRGRLTVDSGGWDR
ncbi:hypothetical protein ACWIBQ_03385 [Microbacterium keratanolyticum]